MNYDLLFAILFYGLLLYLFIKNRDKFIVQNKIIAIYKTKIGLKLMDKIAKKFPKILKILSYISIFIGFAGMIIIIYFLLKSSLDLILLPNAQPAVAPVLPGIKVPGLPNLSFWHWIISIFIVAIVHEFSHGIFARLHKLKVKSSGIAFFGPILAAFVEPDEKDLNKASTKAKLSMMSAGPFSNLIFGFIFLLLMSSVMAPINTMIFEPSGIIVHQTTEGLPVSKTEIETPFLITKINNKETLNIPQFLEAFKELKPKDLIELQTDKGKIIVIATENPDNKSEGYIGISDFEIKQVNSLKKYQFLGDITKWVTLLFFWLFVVNIGVGLFNLLPLGPIDGGRMFHVVALAVFKNKNKAMKAYNFISLFCLLLLFINILPYLIKLIVFIVKPLILLITLLI